MRKFSTLVLWFFLLRVNSYADSIPAHHEPLILMDMVHHNPGLLPTESKFLNPEFLKGYGYGAKVFFLFEAAQFGIDWQKFDVTIFPDTSAGKKWVDEKRKNIATKYGQNKAAGLNVYCMLDMLVFPKKLVEKNRDKMCNDKGKIDISKPFTQKCVRYLINQIFDVFPQLDGIVVRTGETYLQDAPYYIGGSPVVNGMQEHVTLLNILREELCVKRNKKVFYRTWDISQFHSLPKYYLQVTNEIDPHPNLYFSVKHTNVDFWRSAITEPDINFNKYQQYWIDDASKKGVFFNPCIGIGKHQQIVEVQCQREYEGKASQPNYIAKGVIDGFKELNNQKGAHSLNQIKNNKLFAGVWTWSRGGGWGGPYVVNEFWPQLNAFVIATWTKNPEKSEEQIFTEFAKSQGLKGAQINDFHQLCLLSLDGVMEGQYSKMGGVFLNWTRDDNITGDHFLKPYFEEIIRKNKVQEYLDEKHHAVAIWKEIERLSNKLEFRNRETTAFVRASCEYASLKFQLFDVAWQIMLKGYATEKAGKLDKNEMSSTIKSYDKILADWQKFVKLNEHSPSMYKLDSQFFGTEVGLNHTINQYRELITN